MIFNSSRPQRVSAFAVVLVACALVAPVASAFNYTVTGTDPTFQQLLSDGVLKLNQTNTAGVKGSTVNLPDAEYNKLPNGGNSIPSAIRIHTLANSSISRTYFSRWTRWYQEDGHVQIFRLFKGETNTRNDRPLAARIEAFSTLSWTKSTTWHQWQGTYCVVKPHGCSIFQVKNSDNDWAVMIWMGGDGSIKMKRRGGADTILATNMTGKSFNLKVRDNGYDYEVYLNGTKKGTGKYSRPTGKTSFRWGMYLGANELKADAMIFVVGAKFN